MIDVLILGGGAAGLFCAAQLGRMAPELQTVVVERRERPARKLLITGKGRCNLCNDCEPAVLLHNVPHGARFLFSAANAFTAKDTMRFFEGCGVPLKVERGNRVFPVSDKARDIVDALMNAVRQAGVRVAHATASGLLIEEGRACGVRLEGGGELRARSVVVATGGASYPATGSAGDGYRFAAEAGHRVAAPQPALIDLLTEEGFVSELAGLPLRNVTLSLFDRKKPKKPVYRELGELLFTHRGVSGPLVLTASSLLDAGRAGDYFLSIDLKPALDPSALERRVLRDFSERLNRDFANALDGLLPRTLIPIVIRLSGIAPHKKVNAVAKEERAALCRLLKDFRLHIRAAGPLEEAIVTRGGVCTAEVDPRTLRSKKTEDLYFIGEVLDVDGLTGGFNLQIAFSTAFLAAKALSTALSAKQTEELERGKTGL
ncbi:MAG: NAD(P)/FAD-dependent oxidoreductase [Provencibacterium sp.]|nr:NAD(P)/FAD-dependent oxidoreductase [Provencibacterium sp.]